MTAHSKSGKSRNALPGRIAGVALGALAALAAYAPPAAAQVPDAARGRALYENHCVVCHTEKVHSRPNRIAITREEVREIVQHWGRQGNLTWSEQDTADVVEYLGRTRYRFAPVTGKLSRP